MPINRRLVHGARPEGCVSTVEALQAADWDGLVDVGGGGGVASPLGCLSDQALAIFKNVKAVRSPKTNVVAYVVCLSRYPAAVAQEVRAAVWFDPRAPPS